ncbi:MAG TPA: formate dehydrogenase subunit alpha [Methylophaga aminisulfidivorans]|uniref:formate dehydrogenase subunit alpha n=1 Tax=Methylophaga TaxID=40222 RepID=UPI00175BC6B3|nr:MULTISPECIES: formate dehydrogenase subunit alpha [Methylophaga]HIC47252.1 formate dehydrogenase subunit alpha [Methylophaga sp.]HIM40632.1 formate dehydrogenase subunit alpha [Methylophaga aminisulfidivorans]
MRIETFNPNKDYGTPARVSEKLVTVEIDGVEITVPEGTSVMRAASLANINIPKLCATDNLESFGSCRLCAVQIEGRRGYPASCTTTVDEGMKVTTQNSKLAKLRRNVMELYISDHPLDCLTCPANGNCELQDMAGDVGLREVRYGYQGENHLDSEKDNSNPYFSFDPSKCIVCSRCVRACEEVQGTFALTIDGRGFDSKVAAGQDEDFMDSECVSCGACVQACPTSTLMEKSIIEMGQPEHSVVTTCAYCGVGCSFKAEMKGDKVVRMVPYKGGDANHGHSCVKGRFAFGYATHKDRIKAPMIRESITDPWQEVSWEEAINFAATRLKGIQAKYGRESVGGITSSRCTNEESYLVQKLVRAAFGNNNTDTCARVCHSPTGYGLKVTMGESAGTQNFDSVMKSDVIMVIGANPTDAHPVFGSMMRRRLREGADLIVADPRHIDLLKTPHLKKAQHLALRPGSNVALVNAIAHVVVTEGLEDRAFVEKRCDMESYEKWREFIRDERHSPEAVEATTGVAADKVRQAARTYATAKNGAIYYGLGVTEHSQGSTMVMGIANLAMATGNIGREGVGVNPLRGQNNVQGSCDMGSFPHELPGYQHVSDDTARAHFESVWGVKLDNEPGLRIPNMFDSAIAGEFKALYVQGEDIAQSDPGTQHVEKALRSLECLIVQDLFLNETAKFAHVLLPGSSFLEKNGTFTNAERRINRVRKVMPALAGKEDWEITVDLSNALGYPMHYNHPSEIMDEIASLTPTFTGVNYDRLDELGSIQWPCNDENPVGMPTMHVDDFPIGKGRFSVTEYVATDERTNSRFPLLLTTGRILSQYNVGAQTRRTENQAWHNEDVLDIHPSDAEVRGIKENDWLGITSRAGQTVLRARITDKVLPGVVYTTFHHPGSGANVITTDNSDWATNCPEYKVTAVQVERVSQPSEWQQNFKSFEALQMKLLKGAADTAHSEVEAE